MLLIAKKNYFNIHPTSILKYPFVLLNKLPYTLCTFAHTKYNHAQYKGHDIIIDV